jgi:hypothetical protein
LDAIAEYDLEIYRPYLLPTHRFWHGNISRVVHVYKLLGDTASARLVVEEALSQIDQYHPQWDYFKKMLRNLT